MHPPVSYKVVIAEDQVMVAEGLSALLQLHSDFAVLATVRNGNELIHYLNGSKPDIVLLDLNMPVMDGFDACRQIRERFPTITVVALTMYDDEKVRERVKAAGAAGMLSKYTSSQNLAEQLRRIMAGDGTAGFSNTTNNAPAGSPLNEKDAFSLRYKISERELQIIKLITEGFTTEEIAGKLELSYHTVKTYRKNILAKLQLSNSAELTNFMHQHKLM